MKSDEDDMKARSPLEWLLIAVGAVIVVLTLHPAVEGDGSVRFASVQMLLDGTGSYSKFSLVQPILSLPLAWLADQLGHDRAGYVAWFNLLVFALFAGFIYRELARRYTSAIGRAWILLMLMASMYPNHLQHYYGEVFSSFSLFLAVLLLGRRPVVAALLLALGALNTPALLLPLAGWAVAWFFVRRRVAPMAAVALAALLMVAEMAIKHVGMGQGYLSSDEHGFPTVLPYSGRSGFSYPLFLGLLSIVLSFGKGLVFFIPALLLAASARIRRIIGLDARGMFLAIVACGLPVLLYAKWWAWYGGSFWGPRFFLYLCPPACLLLAVALQNHEWSGKKSIAVLLIFLLAAWVGLDGYLFAENELDACWGNNYSQEFLCWYVPEFSALWRPFVTGSVWHKNPRWPYKAWHLATAVYMVAIFTWTWFRTRVRKKNSLTVGGREAGHVSDFSSEVL